MDTVVFERGELAAGQEVAGPAIIEQPDATTVVDPGSVAKVTAEGPILISV